MAVIYGTQGRYFLEGTGLDDIIQGWAKFGDQSTDLGDELIGGGGDDELSSGSGDDTGSTAGSVTTGSPARPVTTRSTAGAAATASSSVASMREIRSLTSRMTSTRLRWTEPLWA